MRAAVADARARSTLLGVLSAVLGCAPEAPVPSVRSDLRLSEVGASKAGEPAWIELENTGDAPIDLAAYGLFVRGVDRATGRWASTAPVTFRLPPLVVPAKGFAVVAGKAYDDLYDGPAAVYLRSGGTVPFWSSGGSIELVSDGESVDYVSFGEGGGAPREPDAWAGAAAPELADGAGHEGTSLARGAGGSDTNGAADWTGRAWATPGGPNDVVDAADDDGDGIPDSAEVPGGTFAGLPLHDWGARAGRKDVFVELDWMDPRGYDGSFDAGIFPRVEAFAKVREVFAARGIEVHFDAGTLGGGGEELPFACRTKMGFTVPPAEGVESFARLRALHFDLRRTPIFHYVVFAHSQDDVACGDDGSSGNAPTPGKDALITLGRWGFSDGSEENRNLLINVQASILMHELGHDFGLLHGGDEDRNYKPGYLSAMNYLYGLAGLPTLGPTEGDRYYYAYGLACGSHGIDDLDQLTNPSTGPPEGFRLDYSDGSGAPLTESSLDELRGLGRSGSGPVDYDWDFGFAAGASADIDAAGSSDDLCVRDGAAGETLTDHDDWSNLVLDARASGPTSAAGPAREARAPRELLERIRGYAR